MCNLRTIQSANPKRYEPSALTNSHCERKQEHKKVQNLIRFIEYRVQIIKKTHWAWNFAPKSLCAITLQQHEEKVDLVKISQNNASACALERPNNNFMTRNEYSVAEGVCVFYDRVRIEWMRSIKCTGRPMQKRIEEHTKSAESKQDSFFYLLRPLGITECRGKHKWLDACLGLGRHPSDGNNDHASFVNLDKCCWKAASHAIKNSLDLTKTKCD